MSCMTMYFYKQVQISKSDIRPHIKWAVSLVTLHMVASIFFQGLCGYTWVNILTLSPQGEQGKDDVPEQRRVVQTFLAVHDRKNKHVKADTVSSDTAATVVYM